MKVPKNYFQQLAVATFTVIAFNANSVSAEIFPDTTFKNQSQACSGAVSVVFNQEKENIVNEQEKQEQETAINEDVNKEEGDKNRLEEMRDKPSMSFRTELCYCTTTGKEVPCDPFPCP